MLVCYRVRDTSTSVRTGDDALMKLPCSGLLPSVMLFFWFLVELKRCYLGVSIANLWVRLSSYTKEDNRRSKHVWSPYCFWRLPNCYHKSSTQIKFIQVYFIAQYNIVAFTDKNTYQFRIFYSSHKFSQINPTDTKYFSKLYLQSAT